MFKIYTLTFLITVFFSLGVQSLFYLWFRFTGNKILRLQQVFQYYSGVIGDGLLVPMLSVFAIKTLYDFHIPLDLSYVAVSLVSGFFITFIFHLGQTYFNLINWTMPQRNNWNLLGLYHGIFMFFESSFLCYVLFSFLRQVSSIWDFAYSPIGMGLLILFAFSLTFIYDYWRTLFKRLFFK